jgi:Tol biopolymer transport system component/predicted Ser/Thr protein kinase
MAILPGRRLGPYEILSAIGAGGMGEVYKARDTRLDRVVAIKVLPAHLADRADLRERFDREAKTIASLNHPHICTLYDTGHQDDIDFLVMEYIEGETLAQRLQKGFLPIQQVLQYAIEISDALDKAHRKGITHRDLKPSNIMLTKSGTKLLDFGLAKLAQDAAPVTAESQQATLKDAVTAQGTILGTLQYMAPEQVEGKTDQIDARTDIFAFGVVVYEMATGKKAFEGKTQASLMAKILETDPAPMSALTPMTPPALDRIVKRCLAKDPDDRWQSARDIEAELKWIADSGSQSATVDGAAAAAPSALGPRRLRLVIAGSLFAAVVSGLVVWFFKSAPAAPKIVSRFSIALPLNQTRGAIPFGTLAISPDGTRIAYDQGRSGGAPQIYLRALNSLEALPIPGTESGTDPFFSPDGQWLGFFSSGALKKVSLNGGAVVSLVSLNGRVMANWTSQGRILLGSGFEPLEQVSELGGNPQTLFPLEKGETGNTDPVLLPGGKEVAYVSGVGSGTGGSRVSLRSVAGGERHDILPGPAAHLRFLPPGYLLYVQNGNLMAAGLDLKRLAVTSQPVAVVEGIPWGQALGFAQYDVSANGTLIYMPGGAQSPLKMVWVDRKGVEQPINAPPHNYVIPKVSPDGRRVAVGIEETDAQIWVYDLGRDALTRLTFQGAPNVDPLWTSDGQRIAYKGTANRLYWQPADGSGNAEQITQDQLGTNNVPGSWSPDGQHMVFTYDGLGGRQLWIYSAKDRKIAPFERNPPPYETAPRFSPDGRWIAYASPESGRMEIYVRPFPGPGGKWQISTDGGTEPIWNPKGHELFYRSGKKMMTVEYEDQQSFSPGKPKELFEGPYVPTPRSFPDYDVSPDGQRFLMLKPAEEQQATSQIIVVQNWIEELKQKVPLEKK